MCIKFVEKKLWLMEYLNIVKIFWNESSSWINILVFCIMCYDKKIVFSKGKRWYLLSLIFKYNKFSKFLVFYCDVNYVWWWIVIGI